MPKHLTYGNEAITLADEVDLVTLADAIANAIRKGGGFVDLVRADGNLDRVLCSTGIPMRLIERPETEVFATFL